MKKYLVLIAWVLIFALVFTGCAKGEDNAPADSPANDSAAADDAAPKGVKNKLAVIAPLTGPNMQYGIAYKTAITMFVEQFNEAGGLNGVDVVVEFHDDKGDQKEAINLANMVVDDDEVFGCVGSFGSAVTMAMAPVFDEANMVLCTPDVSNPDFPAMSNICISQAPVKDKERTMLCELIYEDFDAPKLGIIYANNDNGVYATGVTEKVYSELGGEVVCAETFVPYETDDFTPLLSKCKDVGATCIILDGEYADLANIMLQADMLGMDDVTFFSHGQVLCQEFLDITGEASEGFIVSTVCPSYSEDTIENAGYSDTMIEFYYNYLERWPDESINGFCASGYNAANLLCTAVKEVGTDDPAAIADYIRTCPVESVDSNEWYFEGNSIQKSVFNSIVSDGQFVCYPIA